MQRNLSDIQINFLVWKQQSIFFGWGSWGWADWARWGLMAKIVKIASYTDPRHKHRGPVMVYPVSPSPIS